ncbi:MAG: efflux RND transporter permease subunit [Flavobacteriales bacterium]
MLKTFIARPVLSTAISIIIFILGVLGIAGLPVEQYPDISPATIAVSAYYPGANAETILNSVVVPLEEQINGVEGMTYITSSATNNGTADITVYFNQNVDPDIAAVNVQNCVARATPLLPAEVKQTGVTVKKRQTNSLMFVTFYTTNKDCDAIRLQNYLRIGVIPALQRVEGVADINVYPSETYSMRIWLKPEKLAAYHLIPSDVIAALKEQSVEAAAGSLGQNNGESFSYAIKYAGRFKTEKQYGDIIIKALRDGQYLRLKDVADIELGAQSYSARSNVLGYPSTLTMIHQIKGSNAQKVIERIKTKLNELKKDFPSGFRVYIPYDVSEFLQASIDKVFHTLFEAFILVLIVVFVFLQDLRSVVIPAIAVPVSIVGSFFFLSLFGFSINLLTLFALVLAIGIVVDDAIVVVEAVHAKIDQGAKTVKSATLTAMHEISGAIVSITLVMAAVYLPVTFIQGPTGVFYTQFGITIGVAILISAVNALTLSPALCALFLTPHHDSEDKEKGFLQRFFKGFNQGFNAVIHKYGQALHFLYRNKWITAAIWILACVGIAWAAATTPTGFIPKEDRSAIFADIQLPVGASLDRTYELNEQLYDKIKDLPGIDAVSMTAGFSLSSGLASNYGLGIIKLKDWSEREADSLSIDAITKRLYDVASSIPKAKIFFFTPPSVPGFGISSSVQVNLLDRYGGAFSKLDKVNRAFIRSLMKHPGVRYAKSAFNTEYPQYEMTVNAPIAKASGVSISRIFSTLQGYIGGVYASDFTRFGKQYRVYIQALPKDRATESDLNKLYVRTGNGEMAPITQFVSLHRIYGPQSVTRFNLYNSSALTVGMKPGFSTGDAIDIIEREAKNLPANYDVAYSGITREEIRAAHQTTLIVILCSLFVYFLLAAQYESYLLPLSVLLSLPLGVFGAYFSMKMMGLENNIYFQIALVMLIGLLAKNAILIVEFAIQRRRHGEPLLDSAIDGAKARLRPILMTSFAFTLGLMPLVFANGVGASGNRSIGTGAVGGLLIGTLSGVFVIPMLYILFQWLQEKISGKPTERDNSVL